MVANGLSYKQIAERLVLSHRTVQNHVQNTLGKLQLHNRVELVRYAIEHGLRLPRYPRSPARGRLVDGQLLGARAAAGRARVVGDAVRPRRRSRRPCRRDQPADRLGSSSSSWPSS